MKRNLPDIVAFVLAALAALSAASVADRVFERIPHLEDEFAYLWQAHVIAQGRAYVASPAEPDSFFVPFVIDHQGRRFGKYPPGWPAALSLGVRAHAAWAVNALLAGLSAWLVYRLGAKVAGPAVGLVAQAFAVASPMAVMLSGSLLAHTFSLFLTLAFSLAWLDLFLPDRGRPRPPPDWLLMAVAGLSLGLLGLTRPLTAVSVALPFTLHGVYLLLRDRSARPKLAILAAIAAAMAALLPAWQALLTGDAWLNPYTLWWPYDKVGFGPGFGVTKTGHSWHLALLNTRFSLRAGLHDFLGWPYLSWLFLPAGLFSLRRKLAGWLVFGAFPALVLVHMAYWVGAWVFGPRYYFESLPGLVVMSAAGAAWLGGWISENARRARLRRPLVASLVLILLCLDVLFYLPARVGGMHGLYTISRLRTLPLEHAQLRRAVVFVHPSRWMDYGTLLSLTPPFRESDLFLLYSRGEQQDARVALSFPDWQIFHYYPDEPQALYRSPRRADPPGSEADVD